jgi:dienelactone hydrolase
MIPLPKLSDFTASEMNLLGKSRKVYRTGTTGPGIVLMHEIPGMTPEVLRLGKLLGDEGFRVALPSLFGTDGEPPSHLLEAAQIVRMCVNAEFAVFAANGSSPIVDWLRALCKALATETNSKIGAVGLCITGGFALSLVIGTDGVVQAPVMSEPSLPFPVPFTQNNGALHLTPEEQRDLGKTRSPCMALRFTNDSLCQEHRFDAYQALLGESLVRIEIPSPDAAHGIDSHAHSVLTQELVDAPDHPTWIAYQGVVAFLKQQLVVSPTALAGTPAPVAPGP